MDPLLAQLEALSPERATVVRVNNKIARNALRRMICALGATPYDGLHSSSANLFVLIKLIGGQPKIEGTVWHGAAHVYPRGKELGKGAFAQVFQSGDYALKCLSSKRRAHHDHEIAALRKLQHPNIVELKDWWLCQGKLVLLTDLCVGQSLRSWAGKLSCTEIFALGAQLFSALAHIHERGLVHRDVKPSNVIWDSLGQRLKVLDLGLAADPHKIRQWGGTLAYSLPELWRRRHLPNTVQLLESGDVWSALATLRVVLGAKRPYDGVKQVDELKEIFLKSDQSLITLFKWREMGTIVVHAVGSWIVDKFCALSNQSSALETLAQWNEIKFTATV